jgi:hypothetical protein|tara:strand:+ start:285 stop:419 length:135 start_codon:yes stop_codon:yes gene_type:complete
MTSEQMTTEQQLFRLWKWLEENHEDVFEAYLLTYYAEDLGDWIV